MSETTTRDGAGQPGAIHALDARCRLLVDGDRLVLVTDEAAVVLRGTTTPESIAAGLALLDGTRTQQEIADRLGVPIAQWEQVVTRLADVGLVTAVVDEPSPVPDLLRPVVEALLPTAAGAGQPPESAPRLHLLGRNDALLDALADVWVASGAPEPTRAADVGDDVAPVGALWVHAALTDDELTRTNDAAIEAGVPWLAVAPFDGELMTVGPVHIPGQTCCAECVRIRRAANAPYDAPTRAARLLVSPRLHAAPIIAGLHASLTALVAATFAARPAQCAVGAVHALELPTMRSSRHRVLKVPRCPACSSAADRAIPYPWTRSADVAG